MIPTDQQSSMAGLPSGMKPKKKTRRGGRGGKKHANPQQHLAAAQTALKAGDHAGAKAAAFALIKALPKAIKDDVEALLDQDDATPAVPSPQVKAPGESPVRDTRTRLALALKQRKAG